MPRFLTIVYSSFKQELIFLGDMDTYNCVSSAQNMFPTLCCVISTISNTYNVNNRGPKTDPWEQQNDVSSCQM